MTVKCKAVKFCKFSVTFWVDNEIGGPNSPKRVKYISRESISPLKTQRPRAYGTGTNIFLTGNFSHTQKKGAEEQGAEFFSRAGTGGKYFLSAGGEAAGMGGTASLQAAILLSKAQRPPPKDKVSPAERG